MSKSPSEPVAAKPLTSHDLVAAIRSRYEPPEWRVEPEVTLAGRRLDLVAFNLWGARDYRVVGFEVKVDRGDWMRELAAFEKAEEWQRVVDAFYVVTPPKLIRADELPAGWGHLELCGSRMMTRAYPANRPAGTTLPREVMARFLSRLATESANADRTAKWQADAALRQEVEDRLRETHERERKHDRDELKQIRQEYNALLAVLGIQSREWQAHESAMRAAGVLSRYERDGAALRKALERATKEIGAHHASLQAALESLALDNAA